MSESSESSKSCPQCGAALPAEATAGLCPRCLMAEAMEPTQTDSEPASPRKTLAPEELAPHFPQLEILECLGRGGMGVVYKARQKTLNRFVALKLLAPERVEDAAFARRFTQEAQALAALNHPNIVTIYDFGQAGGFYFLLMEFVDGVNLRQAMKAGRFTPDQALAVVPPVCEAMQCAHEHGIVHRDIKPENLLLDKDGRVKIADFGIAKMLGGVGSPLTPADSAELVAGLSPEGERETDRSNASASDSLTPIGGEGRGEGASAATFASTAGTPQYMAPEQKENGGTDHRADIYSLGVVLYELLTGELPADKIQPPSRKVQIDVRLDEIVLRALESNPELRYQTAGEMRTQVETFTSSPRSSRGDEAQTSGMDQSLLTSAATGSRSRFIKSGFSVLTTPERLATAAGQFLCIQTRGQLILDSQQLTHSRHGVNTIIPLAAIRDLSIGKFPRTVNPAGIDLLSVTYEVGGIRRQVLLSPAAGWFAFPGNYNAGVMEWFGVIREAVIDASGTEPTVTPPDKLGLPGSSPVLLLLFVGMILLVNLPLMLMLQNQKQPSPVVSQPTMEAVQSSAFFLLLAGVFGIIGGFLIWRVVKGVLKSDEADREPRFSRTAMLATCWIPAFLLVFPAIWFLRQGGSASHGWRLLVLLVPILLGATAPFGTTILGWLAVSRIRRSAGKLYGLGLAVFDGLLFPLLALDLVILWTFFFFMGMLVAFYTNLSVIGDSRIDPPFLTWVANDVARQGASVLLIVFLVVLVLAAVDFLIIRAIWRKVNRSPIGSPAASPEKSRPGCLRSLLISVFLVVTVFGAAVVLWRTTERLRPVVAPSFTPVRLDKNVVILDFVAVLSQGPAEAQVYMDGPQLPAKALQATLSWVDSKNAEVVTAGSADKDRQVHPLRTGTNSWRAVLVLPTEALAREVWENLQPLGPLEVQPDHWTGGELFEVTAPGDGTYTGYFTVGRVRPQADARSEFPTGAHIGRNNDSIVVTHDNVDLHHVLYYAGNFGSSSSGWQNAKTHSWVDEGAIKLKNGRTFGYRRIALYPDELIVNGARYDLRKGRVFVLNDDGMKEQLSLTVSLSTAKDPIALGALIARHGVGTPAPPVKITPAVKIARQPAPTPVKVTKGVNNGISNILTDNTSATFDAQVKVGEALRVFIGDDYPGWSTMPVKSGPISVIVKASSQIRLDDGSLGRGFTIKTDGGTVYVAITPEGPVPFGELIFRTADKVTAKSGNHTFADIRKPDGTLVPMSACVRRAPTSTK